MNRPRSLWIFAFVVTTLVSLPLFIALNNTPEGWQYSGALPIPGGVLVDYNSHIAKMWQGARGEWDYRLLFTHEEHPGLYTVQGFYVLLGAVAGLLNLNFAVAYHAARMALTVAMVISLWDFSRIYFDQERDRWLVVIFGTLVTGWGWMILPFTAEIAPIEFWLSDAYNLIGAMVMPHFAAAIWLQMLAFMTYESWRKNPKPYHITILTLVLFCDAIIQPYIVLLTFSLFGLLTAYHVFIGKTLSFRSALWLIIPALFHGGIVVYQFLAIQGDPIWANFTEQNITLSPPIAFYVVGYLPFLLLLIPGMRPLWHKVREDDRWLLPVFWLLLVLLLLYAPLPTQRRYLLGVQTPLAVLAVLGWRTVSGQYPLLMRRIFIPYIALSGLPILLLIVANTGALTTPENQLNVFYTGDERAGADWLHEHAAQDALILPSFSPDAPGANGAIVALTGMRVFSGHWIETAHYEEKQLQIQQFFAFRTEDEWRQDFLIEIGAKYIWYDRADDLELWNPQSAEYLEAVFTSDTLMIYEVIE